MQIIFFSFLLLFVSSILQAANILQTKVPDYVGAAACQNCHMQEYNAWKGSHHDLAMQKASVASVLGSFNKTLFTHNGITSTFYKDKDRFMVKTDGPDGKLHNYEISYTFGVYPLQQYMVKFPKGKIQVLDIAWDSRVEEKGGQRWFSLHPNENIKAGNVLHWTGPNLNWNYMCADCHSTYLKKNYLSTTQSYNTKWAEINVSCEACHGPASKHLDWAKTKKTDKKQSSHSMLPSNGLTIDLSNTAKRHWQINKKTSKPALTDQKLKNKNKQEIEVCAKCHSRRSQLTDDFVPGQNFRDHYLPALLDENLYFLDGKIKDEVYVYGSFQQSKMFAEGVECSDCHNPHTLGLKLPGDQVCSQCHLTEKYESTKHHFHKKQSAGSSCISCHMPSRTYMGVDERNDHSFRIPRPDLADSLKTPDACTLCHQDKKAKWAADSIKQWNGSTPEGYQNFGKVLAALNNHDQVALQMTYQLLQADAPKIAKATVIRHLGNYTSRQTLLTAMQMLISSDADIRRQALQALESFPLQHTLPQIYKKLEDPVLIVRIEAARILAPIARGNLNEKQKDLLKKVTNEYHQSLLFTAERPETQLSLALLYQNRPELGDADKAYKEALRLQPQYIPAYINYAAFLQRTNETEAFNILQQGLKQQKTASLIHTLGLWYIRDKQIDKGNELIKEAAILNPDNTRYQYVYAVSIGAKSPKKAINILKKSLLKHNGDLLLLSTLVSYYNKLNDKINSDLYKNKIKKIMKVTP